MYVFVLFGDLLSIMNVNKMHFYQSKTCSFSERKLWIILAWIGFYSIQSVQGWFGQDEYLNNFASTHALGAPLITPTASDVTLEVHSNFTLRCESKIPIKWEIPDLFDTVLVHKVENYPTSDPERPYGSQLTLYNVTADYVRYYYCMDESAELIDDMDELITQFKASQIYVFVNDLDNLLVPHGHPIITAFQYSDIVIPCKPTSKEIEVELSSPNGEISNEYDQFDPKVGFTMLNVSNTKYIQCTLRHSSTSNLTDTQLYAIVIQPITQSVKKPEIRSATGGHAREGDTFNLTCTVDVPAGVMFTISWRTPKENAAIKENRVEVSDTAKETLHDGQVGKSILTVFKASKEKDTGYYRCEVEDHSHNTNHHNFLVIVLEMKNLPGMANNKIMKAPSWICKTSQLILRLQSESKEWNNKNESYLNLSEPSGHYLIKIAAGKQVMMKAYYRGYPKPSFTWYNNKNMTLSATSAHERYTIDQSDYDVTLTMRSVTYEDSGVYHLHGSNGIIDKIISFTLYVKDKPKVSINPVYIQKGEEARLLCKCGAYPEAKVIWSFTPCKIKPKWPTCDETKSVVYQEGDYTIKEKEKLFQLYELKFTPSQPGLVKCSAENTEGKTEKEVEILIGDLIEPVAVYGIDDNRKIAIGDEVSLTCAALAYNYSADIFWYRDNILIENGDGIDLVTSHSEYSYKKVLKFRNIQPKNQGLYECRAHPVKDDQKYEHKMIDVDVYDPLPPTMESTNLESTVLDRSLGSFLLLECKASGIPKPIVTWFKDSEPIDVSKNESRANVQEDGTVLEIPFIKPEDEGMYKCLVSNRLGSIERSIQLRISDLPGLKTSWIIVIGVVFLILMIFIVYLCIRIFREKELRRQLKAAGLANFEEGAVEHINPALSLDEQADLLPYDRRFEFPKEKLKLGKQLGAGAFGVVLKAQAEGILPDERETTVAVKMVKRTADNEVIRALVSELKIMVHLGQHLNVVNLLGAVTKDIAKREIMVIVEFCRYGNLQNFLLKNRKRFINQINPDTDQIDQSITSKEQRWSSDYEYNSKSDGESHPNTQGYVRQSEIDYIGSHVDSCNTEQTLISSEGDLLSNNSVQPAWRSNYKPDCTTEMDITTTHLVSWAFQVARGMEYLASRKVLHGDLAARNILLSDDNVVKICDFGLARTMYKNDNYKKQGEARLPIKWLALESLGDQIFSTYSDVWSFGIVLWEFFTLAKVPYPGMDADQTLYLKLKDGYRMEKPEFANQDLYDIMLECWSANPESRPVFHELEKKLGRLLEDELSNHYIDLNEPYMRINSEYYKMGQTDYLALMGCPEEPAPSAPRYVNGHMLPEIKIAETGSEYLQMSPKSGTAIFSPRPQNDYVTPERFNFPEPTSPTISNNLDSPMPKNRKKTGIPEEIPMLKHTHSDSESELSPDPKSVNRNFSKFQGSNEDIEARLEKNDNYVNVHPNDSHKKNGTKDAFSNPSYLMLQTINETRNK